MSSSAASQSLHLAKCRLTGVGAARVCGSLNAGRRGVAADEGLVHALLFRTVAPEAGSSVSGSWSVSLCQQLASVQAHRGAR